MLCVWICAYLHMRQLCKTQHKQTHAQEKDVTDINFYSALWFLCLQGIFFCVNSAKRKCISLHNIQTQFQIVPEWGLHPDIDAGWTI